VPPGRAQLGEAMAQDDQRPLSGFAELHPQRARLDRSTVHGRNSTAISRRCVIRHSVEVPSLSRSHPPDSPAGPRRPAPTTTSSPTCPATFTVSNSGRGSPTLASSVSTWCPRRSICSSVTLTHTLDLPVDPLREGGIRTPPRERLQVGSIHCRQDILLPA